MTRARPSFFRPTAKAMAALVMMACVAQAEAAPGAAACAALGNQSSRSRIPAIPNTVVTSATYVTAATGNYCQVTATVAPSHDVAISLPDGWQRRYLQLGGSGFDGVVQTAARFTGGNDPVAAGFVIAGDNGGHRVADYVDGAFGIDRGLTLSYATAKIFDTNMVAKALMLTYYGQLPQYRYFDGCSNGGKNASVAAANFPDYFDGIIGSDGVWGHAADHVGGSDMAGLTSKWSQSVQVGALATAKATALYNATVQACDALDGVADGIVSNVNACPFRQVAQSLSCSASNGATCLTDGEIAQVNAHTSSLTLKGLTIGAPWSGIANMANVAAPRLPQGFLSMAFRRAAPVDPLTYDIPNQFNDVVAVLDGVYNMTGSLPGIVKYVEQGKKLMMFHGWEDTTVPSFVSINFVNALAQASPQGASNVKLYMAGGVGHCGGGVGADQVDLVTALSKWVEQNVVPGAPSNPVVAFQGGTLPGLANAKFSRPMCNYPQYPAYQGQGSVNAASSYACAPGPAAPAYTQ